MSGAITFEQMAGNDNNLAEARRIRKEGEAKQKEIDA